MIQVRVTWNTTATASYYRIYRAEGDSDDFGPIATTSDGATDFYLDQALNGWDYTYYVVAVEGLEESAAQPAPGDDLDRATDPFDPTISVRNLRAVDGEDDFVTYNKHSRRIALNWSRVPESQVIGYHVYRKCDWSRCESMPAKPFTMVPFLDHCTDIWLRMTEQPVTVGHFYEDLNTGGLGGCFLYAVRPVGPNHAEGQITKVLNVDVPVGNYPSGARCEADDTTYDPYGSWPPYYDGFEIPTQDEIDRVNGAARGTGSAGGSPPAPQGVQLDFGNMPAGIDDSYCIRVSPIADTSACFGYEAGMRWARYAEVSWGPVLSQRPADLAGYHIETAGSSDGPWRRVTDRPVAWWESKYRIPAVGIRKFDPSGECPPDGCDTTECENDCYSGNLNCLHFRVFAIDEYGNESPFGVTPSQPGCSATPPAPQGLQASTEDPNDPCTTKLEWDPVPGADEYRVYRRVLRCGKFFYNTEILPGTETQYVEAGDLEYLSDDPGHIDPDLDCPTAPGWQCGTQFPGSSCRTGFLEAYYVTARYASGGESPRSEIVFWHCNPLYEYASFFGGDDRYDAYTGFLDGRAVSADGECDVVHDIAYYGECALETESDWLRAAFDPLVAPLLTLGDPPGTTSPPFKILDLHVDHLGSVRLVTDENQDIVSQHDFFPFGEEIMPMMDYSTKMFTGHERDRETGLDYMMARYYGSSVGRFSSTDPGQANTVIQTPPSWNGYAYSDNNPVRYVDPDGRFSQEDHIEITFDATGDRQLARGVARVDHLVPGIVPFGDQLVNPSTHFGGEKKAQKLLDQSVEAFNSGKHKKADKLLNRALHAFEDDIAHRDFDGSRIGWLEHGWRNFKDLFVKGCKFSPDCEDRPDYKDKKKRATKKAKEKNDEQKQRTGRGKNKSGIDPDGPFGPAPNPCQGMGPLCGGAS